MTENFCRNLECGEEIATKRWDLGYRTCIKCGTPRKEFTVSIPYNKGPYMVIPKSDIKDMGRK